MSELAKKKCVPCKGDTPALKGHDLTLLLDKLGNGWSSINEHHLEKKYDLPDFRQALDFTNRVGELAEQQGHHPDIYLAWGKVILTVWTHKIDGLTESDFIFAAKADQELNQDASKSQESEAIERAVYDGMQDLRVKKSR
ncbi:MAG: 4a-hydroxytetrahydrobiopterin dehydratase [Pseudomonadota bacterium]